MDVEFFERHVRPLLQAHCVECHSGEAAEAALRLDSPEAVNRGAETGPIVVAGHPEQSRLIEVVRYTGDIQMPPDRKLSDEQIALLVDWVRRGAVWPDAGDMPSGGEGSNSQPATPEAGALGPATYALSRATHWAFQPIRQPPMPAVAAVDWPQTSIDYFILARLEEAGLTPSPEADRRTLLRRMYFDVTGLPPTAEECDSFAADRSSDAVQRTVDRLLHSPHYGERWGRHWLDVARYADTKGYVFTAEPRYPYSYTYRDYVVRSLNEDLPYDRFVVEQLAADLLLARDAAADKRSLAALGFLTLGRRFNNNIHDIIDDRIDVVTRGLMGLTVACARCHDHKYDPVPTEDYYSLYGVFASCVEPEELPLIAPLEETEAYAQFTAELNKRQAAVARFEEQQTARIEQRLREQATHYLLGALEGQLPQFADEALSFDSEDLRPSILKRWQAYLKKRVKPDDAVFVFWARLADVPAEAFLAESQKLLAPPEPDDGAAAAAAMKLNRLVREHFQNAPPQHMVDVVRGYGEIFASVEAMWRQALQAAVDSSKAGEPAAPPAALEDADAEQIRQVLYADDSPCRVSGDQLLGVLDRAQRNQLRELRKAVDQWKAESPDAPARAMVLVDREKPIEPHVFLRGNPGRQGPAVKRRFLSLLSEPQAADFQQGSGRLELAQRIVSPDNPLTARVIVNRVWQQYFGVGLVSTASDFGTRGERPSHPDLLDHLSQRFMENGWSLKWLHREILLSATYQQDSRSRPECVAVDPENRLFWKMNRRPLEFEPLRDAMLAVSGQLRQSIGGRPFNLLANEPASQRRTIYGFIDRQDLPNLLRVFNFASPDSSVDKRPATVVPQQALFMMNSPFVVQRARAIAAKCGVEPPPSDTAQAIERLFRRVLSREPTPAELAAASAFVAEEGSQVAGVRDAGHETVGETAGPGPDQSLTPWERLAQALLMTNEFAFID